MTVVWTLLILNVCLFSCTELRLCDTKKFFLQWGQCQTHCIFYKKKLWFICMCWYRSWNWTGFSPLFWQSECLKNIKKDLLYYHEAIASYLTGPLKNGPEEIRLLSPIVEITKNLTEVCLSCNFFLNWDIETSRWNSLNLLGSTCLTKYSSVYTELLSAAGCREPALKGIFIFFVPYLHLVFQSLGSLILSIYCPAFTLYPLLL